MPTDGVPPTITPTPRIQHFYTLPPGSPLPGDAQCAALVRPAPELVPANEPYNMTVGSQRLSADFFTGGDPRADILIAPRVTGNFTGTTDEILQWAACKWGIDEDIVRAQALQESDWSQALKGDFGNHTVRCAPGHGINVDGDPGQCPESFGILQVKFYFYRSAWPSSVMSTAFNVDTALAVWRACYEGYETWLNEVPRGRIYMAGDLWGCLGRWYSGQWHTSDGEAYIALVNYRLGARRWQSVQYWQSLH